MVRIEYCNRGYSGLNKKRNNLHTRFQNLHQHLLFDVH